MKNSFVKALLFCVPALVFMGMQCLSTERIFILKNEEQIIQYRVRESQNEVTRVVSYTEKDFPGMFPAYSIEMKRGNILSFLDQSRNVKGRVVYDPNNDRLKSYEGRPGNPASLRGRVLENPDLNESFRRKSDLYFKDWANPTRHNPLAKNLPKKLARSYRDIFFLDGLAFGIWGDHIDQISGKMDEGISRSSKRSLVIPGSELTSAALSPWGEVFIADAATSQLHRVGLSKGKLVLKRPVRHSNIRSPQGLDFTRSGELFVANGEASPDGVCRFKFKLGNFKNWNPQASKGLDFGSGCLDVALAHPVGYVISEKTHPLVKLNQEKAGGHYGISQVLFIAPYINKDQPTPNAASESSTIALVEYEPGGNTPVHYHDHMEQIEVVLEGRALWEIGEFEREVGPGDVIFTPRFVKHGYKVLGKNPFKFLQLEWRNLN